MGALIVWSEEERAKDMVFWRFASRGDRTNFRL